MVIRSLSSALLMLALGCACLAHGPARAQSPTPTNMASAAPSTGRGYSDDPSRDACRSRTR